MPISVYQCDGPMLFLVMFIDYIQSMTPSSNHLPYVTMPKQLNFETLDIIDR